MRRVHAVEDHRDRVALAREAGYGRASGFGVVAGTVAAFGTAAILLGVAGGIAGGLNGGSNFSAHSTSVITWTTGVVVAFISLVAFSLGGYTAGRMARRSGGLNGFLAWLAALVVAGAFTLWTWAAGATHVVSNDLGHLGAPGDWHSWRTVAIIFGIASLAAGLVGALSGGMAGARWHTKLAARAADPAYGPQGVASPAAPATATAGAPASPPVMADSVTGAPPVWAAASPTTESPLIEAPMTESPTTELPATTPPASSGGWERRPVTSAPGSGFGAPAAEDPTLVSAPGAPADPASPATTDSAPGADPTAPLAHGGGLRLDRAAEEEATQPSAATPPLRSAPEPAAPEESSRYDSARLGRSPAATSRR